jgi:hypothetical protein
MLPAPQPGLVIRYSYLWAREAAQGREEGAKERPAAVVLAVARSASAAPRVYVLPITHSRPEKEVEAIELPPAVARKAGLDAARSWVILTEFNEFVWPGFDLAAVPGRTPPTAAYGYLPPGFFVKMRDRWLEPRRRRQIPRCCTRRGLDFIWEWREAITRTDQPMR